MLMRGVFVCGLCLCLLAFARASDEPAAALVEREVAIIERLDAPNCGPRESKELKKELKALMLTHGDGIRYRNYGVQKNCEDGAASRVATLGREALSASARLDARTATESRLAFLPSPPL